MVLTTLLLTTAAIGQQVLLHEEFEGSWSTTNPPPGWTIVWDGDTAANDWHRATDLGRNPWPDNPTHYALLDSSPFEAGLDSLISPPVSCADYNVVTLRCSTYFQGAIAPYQAVLYGSVSGGPFEYRVFEYTGMTIGPQLQTFLLDWAANQTDVRLAWSFQGASSMVPFWCIDNVTLTGEVQTADVGCSEILAPADTIDSLSSVVPVAVVHNFGTVPASFPVFMEIGTMYRDSVRVESLPGGADDTVEFRPWSAGVRGETPLVCYTALPGDVNPANDRIDRFCNVRVLNVTVLVVIQPSDTLDSGQVVTPQARVANAGQDTADFYAFMRIGTWLDSVLVDRLGPGQPRDLSFTQWRAAMAGPGTAVCSLLWSRDRYPSDDTESNRFFVRGLSYRDAGAERILSPSGTVRESVYVQPRGAIKNHGAMAVNVVARLTLLRGDSTVYLDSVHQPLQPRQLDTVSFAAWLASPADSYTARLGVTMSGDMNPENDTTSERFYVTPPIHDVGTVRVYSPVDTIPAGPVVPGAWLKNYGNFPETFKSQFRITRSQQVLYAESAWVFTLQPGDSTRLNFPTWNSNVGPYIARCSTALPGDANAANNLRMNPFWAESLSVLPGWTELESVPRTPSGKPVQAGAGLTIMNRTIYGMKGNKTTDFYVFSFADSAWHDKNPIPNGVEGKPVGKGGSLCNDGNRYIYAVKGNNTQGFYRYDVVLDSWRALDTIPRGSQGKKVKQGSKTVFVVKSDSSWVYLLKGYKSEFYRYNVIAGRWDTLPRAPTGERASYAEGSFIVYDGEYTIYCVKAKYNEHYRFDIRGDTWYSAPLTKFPLQMPGGREKKVKGGGSGTWYSDAMYCFKGGNTQEFWYYRPGLDSWYPLDTIPAVGVSGRKKRVKDGGNIVAAGFTLFYALKGNKCGQFWLYRIPPAPGGMEENVSGEPGLWTGTTTVVHDVLFVPQSPPFVLHSLFDLSGRKVLPLRPGRNDVSGLSPGVYFLHSGMSAVSGQPSAVTKVIIE